MTKHFNSMEEALKEFDRLNPHPGNKPDDVSQTDWDEVMLGYEDCQKTKSFLSLIWQSATKVEAERIIKVVEKLESKLKRPKNDSGNSFNDEFNNGHYNGQGVALTTIIKEIGK